MTPFFRGYGCLGVKFCGEFENDIENEHKSRVGLVRAFCQLSWNQRARLVWEDCYVSSAAAVCASIVDTAMHAVAGLCI